MENLVEQPRMMVSAGKQTEREMLETVPTTALLKQALSDIKLLAKAELLHARLELKEELLQAKTAGILLGCCVGLLICGASVAFVGVALALPVAEPAAAFLVAGFLLVVAAVCGAAGYRRLPKKPMQKTQQRIKEDLALARERLA
jgi:hypothetical protein